MFPDVCIVIKNNIGKCGRLMGGYLSVSSYKTTSSGRILTIFFPDHQREPIEENGGVKKVVGGPPEVII